MENLNVSRTRRILKDFGKALYFDGVNDYAEVPIVPLSTGFCFAMDLRIDERAVNQRVLANNNGAYTTGFYLSTDGTNVNRLQFATLGASPATLQYDDLQIGREFHIVITFEPNSAKMYINGHLHEAGINTDTVCAYVENAITMRMGTLAEATTTKMKGSIDNFIFQNTTTPWTAEQVQDLYYRHIVPDGATHYDMNDNVLDQSEIADALTLTNTSYSPRTAMSIGRPVIRNITRSVKFALNATNNMIAVTQNFGLPISQQNNFTLAGWVQNTNNVLDTYLFSEGNSGNNTPVFGVHYSATIPGALNLFNKNDAGAGGDVLGTKPVLKPNEKQHLILVGTGGVLKIYVNGKYTGQSLAIQSGVTTLNRTTWGALGRVTYAGSFGGNLSKLMIFSRAFSDSDAKNLYLNDIYDATGLLSYLKIEETSGTNLADSSGNGNVGTLTGATLSTRVPFSARAVASNRVQL